MALKKGSSPCAICNPSNAEPGEYCDAHSEELHRLDHHYETLFRLQRISRGKDHESYHVFLTGRCDPCGRVLVNETDPENLAITVLISNEVDLETRIAEYQALGIDRTWADQLRQRVEEVIHSWYGNSRACVDVYSVTTDQPDHWDIARREEQTEEEPAESHPVPGKHSVH
jgi:hypothetical protein